MLQKYSSKQFKNRALGLMVRLTYYDDMNKSLVETLFDLITAFPCIVRLYTLNDIIKEGV